MNIVAGGSVYIRNPVTKQVGMLHMHEVFKPGDMEALIIYGTIGSSPIWLPRKAMSRIDTAEKPSCVVILQKEPNAQVEAATQFMNGNPLYLCETEDARVGVPILNRNYASARKQDKDAMVERAIENIKLYYRLKDKGALPNVNPREKLVIARN